MRFGHLPVIVERVADDPVRQSRRTIQSKIATGGVYKGQGRIRRGMVTRACAVPSPVPLRSGIMWIIATVGSLALIFLIFELMKATSAV